VDRDRDRDRDRDGPGHGAWLMCRLTNGEAGISIEFDWRLSMARQAPTIVLDPLVRQVLARLKRSRTLGQHLAERVRIVLMSAAAKLCSEQAAQLEVDAQRVRRWRRRWAERQDRLAEALAQGADAGALEKLIRELLSDEYRSGSRGKFTAEQVAAIIALACEDPAQHQLPVSHWTPQELATKAKERGIVESISPRQVGRFLKGGTAKAAHVTLLAQSQANRSGGIPGAGECGLRRVPASACA